MENNFFNSITSGNINLVAEENAGVSYSQLYAGNWFNLQEAVVVNIDLGAEREDELFNPSYVFFENRFYWLSDNLNCRITVKDNTYYLECASLKLIVWGATKEEAVKSFNFSFHSLYKNYVEEADNRLSADAKKLKRKLLSLVA